MNFSWLLWAINLLEEMGTEMENSVGMQEKQFYQLTLID